MVNQSIPVTPVCEECQHSAIMSKPYFLSLVVFSIIPCLSAFISLPWCEMTLRIKMSFLCLSLLALLSTLCASILVEVLLVVVSLP